MFNRIFSFAWVLIFMSLLVLTLNPCSAQFKFQHPGIPFNEADLERMNTNKDKEPWRAAYEVLLKDKCSQLDYRERGPHAKVNREPNENLSEYIDDSTAVFYQSVLYSVTGEKKYAENALRILRAWMKTHKEWGGGTVFLAASDHGLYFIQGAEILRYTYSGWTRQDTRDTESYCEEMLWPLFHFPRPLRYANQGAAQLKGGIAVAVFCNDQEKFYQVLEAYANDPGTGPLNILSNGQTGDSGRDQGHAFGMLKNMTFTCEVAHRQGVDLYSLLDNRLMVATEYYAKYNWGEDAVEWIPYGTPYGYYKTMGERGRKRESGYLTGYLEQAYGAFVVRAGKKLPYLTQFRDGQTPNVDTFLYRKDKDDSKLGRMPHSIPDHRLPVRYKFVGLNLDEGKTGKSTYDKSTRTITLNGAGDLYGGAEEDECFFELARLTKDATLVARVVSVSDSSRLAKGGLVFRESLNPDSKMLAVYGDSEDSMASTWRGGELGGGKPSQTFKDLGFPFWLKVERKKARVNAYVSHDGEAWTPIRSGRFEGVRSYYLGLFCTSLDSDEPSTVVFDHVQILGAGR